MADPGERIDVDDGTARIELRRKTGPNLWTVVDAEDLERTRRHGWYALIGKRTNYAVAEVRAADGHRTSLYLHRFLLDAPHGLDVDHRDHDGLNNRRANLRLATESQNLANARALRGGSSQYKGVTWSRSDRTWKAQIRVNRKNITLGRFPVEADAARAYDAAAMAAWGEFACLNFPS